jgi:protein-tyrosine phosphatase
MQTVLFLCTGNYYRSRFAEILFNWHADRTRLPWRAYSRGLALTIFNRGPISSHAATRLSELGIPFDTYLRLPRAVVAEDFDRADYVVAVKEAEHRPLIERGFPDRLARVEFWEVHDLDCAGPEVAIPHLEREVAKLLGRLERA